MHSTKQYIPSICAGIGILVLIMDSKTSLYGAQEGVRICIESVIPSLLPMIFLSVFLNSRLFSLNLGIIRVLTSMVGIPNGMEGILLGGWLGGYPVGAQMVSQAYKNEEIDKSTATHLLSFCSNAGPSFIFGILSSMFNSKIYIWLLWLVHIGSSYVTGLLLTKKNGVQQHKMQQKSPLSAPAAIKNTTVILSSICAWVIFFRVVLQYSNRWFMWLLPQWAVVIFNGVIELTNGCLLLKYISDEGLRFIVCSGVLAFGGICVFMQTTSVISPLKAKSYLLGKFVQTIVSLGLSVIVLVVLNTKFQIVISVFAMVFVFLVYQVLKKYWKIPKKCSIMYTDK